MFSTWNIQNLLSSKEVNEYFLGGKNIQPSTEFLKRNHVELSALCNEGNGREAHFMLLFKCPFFQHLFFCERKTSLLEVLW